MKEGLVGINDVFFVSTNGEMHDHYQEDFMEVGSDAWVEPSVGMHHGDDPVSAQIVSPQGRKLKMITGLK